MTATQATGKNKITRLYLKRVCVLFLYAVLFTAHLLSSFFLSDETSRGTYSFQAEQPASGNSLNHVHIQQSGKDNSAKPVVRLNKRFQPEHGIIPINTYSLPLPAGTYNEVAKIGHPTAYLLFTVVLAQSMRGPPAVA